MYLPILSIRRRVNEKATKNRAFSTVPIKKKKNDEKALTSLTIPPIKIWTCVNAIYASLFTVSYNQISRYTKLPQKILSFRRKITDMDMFYRKKMDHT